MFNGNRIVTAKQFVLKGTESQMGLPFSDSKPEE